MFIIVKDEAGSVRRIDETSRDDVPVRLAYERPLLTELGGILEFTLGGEPSSGVDMGCKSPSSAQHPEEQCHGQPPPF